MTFVKSKMIKLGHSPSVRILISLIRLSCSANWMKWFAERCKAWCASDLETLAIVSSPFEAQGADEAQHTPGEFDFKFSNTSATRIRACPCTRGPMQMIKREDRFADAQVFSIRSILGF